MPSLWRKSTPADRSHRFERSLLRAFAWLATMAFRATGDWPSLRPLLSRTSAHVAVIVVAVVAIALSGVEWPVQASRGVAPLRPFTMAPPVSPAMSQAQALAEISRQNSQLPVGNRSGTLARFVQPHTLIPERPRLSVITYTVQAGDTTQAIAAMFGLEPTTIMWSNSAIEDAPDLLRIGQEVVILPIDGVYHTVTEDDTLESIAEKYEAEVEAITGCEYNHLQPPYVIQAGMRLIVPGGTKPYVPRVVTSYTGPVPQGARGTGMFQWPVLGLITQGYWWGHRAVDIGAPVGSAVLAADGGFVSFAGWTDVGFGYLVVIDHANGYSTYYAHLSNFYVTEGQAVARGQVIGAVGLTGWTTGPHLHFEIRYYGEGQNPRAYLP